jgi:hypothetical protein
MTNRSKPRHTGDTVTPLVCDDVVEGDGATAYALLFKPFHEVWKRIRRSGVQA